MDKYLIIKSNIRLAGYYDDGGEYCCNGEEDISVEQSVISLEDSVKEKWFHDLMRNNGFYHKDELVGGETHLGKFVYDVVQHGRHMLYSKLSDVYHPEIATIAAVYQEVVGVERVGQVELFEKNKDLSAKKTKEKEKEDAKKKLARAEKRRQKEIEKARKILEEAGEKN